jgi:hypothetical protein
VSYTETGFEIKTTRTITRDQVANLLANAFEGGSNYWYLIEEFHAPSTYQFNYGADLKKPAGYFTHIDYPLNPDGYLVVSDYYGADDGKVVKRRLNYRSIKRGLQLMSQSKTYAHHWRDFIDENDDAITADVFLQFCLFGDVIYG